MWRLTLPERNSKFAPEKLMVWKTLAQPFSLDMTYFTGNVGFRERAEELVLPPGFGQQHLRSRRNGYVWHDLGNSAVFFPGKCPLKYETCFFRDNPMFFENISIKGNETSYIPLQCRVFRLIPRSAGFLLEYHIFVSCLHIYL